MSARAQGVRSVRQLFPASILGKLVLLFTAVIAAISGFFYWRVPSQIGEQAQLALESRAGSIAAMAAFSVRSAIVFEDRDAMRDALNGAVRGQDVLYVAVAGADRRILTVQAPVGSDNDAHAIPGQRPSGSVYRVRVPVEWQGDTIGYVSLGMRAASVDDQVRRARDTAAVVSLLVFLTATLAVLLVSRVVTRPLHEMVRAALRISEGDLSERADIRSRDEVGRLAQAFNVMVGRLQEAHLALEGSNRSLERRVEERTHQLVESEHALRHAQKMEAVGRLAAGVAHDFNNLLTVINGHAELGLMILADEDPARESLTSIASAGASAAALTQQLLAFSRKQMLQPTELQLHQAIGDMEQILEGLLGETVHLDLRFDPDLGFVCVDRGQLQQVVMNLAVNAKDAMPAGGRLTIATANRTIADEGPIGTDGVPPGEYVELEITDTGHGMTESVRTRAFEPFFSTKAEGKGTGLGLSTVYGIVAQSGGHLLLDSEVGRGTTFRVLIPRITPAASAAAEGRDDPSSGGAERILLVEDADGVRELARRMLEREGYQVIEAACGADALDRLEAARGEFDLVLTDIVMPRMNGREFAEEVGRRYPDIALVYMSGYTDDEVVLGGVRDHDVVFIEKPFSRRTLLDAVRGALDERRAAAA